MVKNKLSYFPVIPWVMFTGGLAFTVFAVHFVMTYGEAEARQRFLAITTEISNAIVSEMEVHEAVLRGTAGFIGASESVHSDEFHVYVERLRLRTYYPGIQSIGLVEKPAVVDQTSDTVAYQSTRIQSSSAAVQIKFLEPVERYIAALSNLVVSEPAARAAMVNAGENGVPSLSAPVTLTKELKQQAMLMFIPVYNGGGVPSTLTARRQTLSGFAVGLFRTEYLFNAILDNHLLSPIRLHIFDATTTTSPVLIFGDESNRSGANLDNPHFVHSEKVHIRGRMWRLDFSSPDDFGSAYLKGAVPATAGAGVVFSVLILLFGLGQVRQRKNAEVAIRKLRKSEHDLQEAGSILEWKVAERTDRLEQTIAAQALMKDFTDQLQACFTIAEASGAINHYLQKLFPSWCGCVTLLKASKNALDVIGWWGAEECGDLLFSPDDCWALRRGRVHYVEDGGSGVACSHFSNPSCSELLCVPMLAQGETVGTLHLSRKAGIRPLAEEAELAVKVAEHVGLVLANIKLREVLRAQSVRDPLTNLFNRRYMEASLERELARCARNQKPLSVMMMDLDHFKNFNDTYGHDAGDEILRGLSNILQGSIRNEDIACRYGGEEFIIILPDADVNCALLRAEEIRARIDDAVINHRGRSYDNLTISIGVATFPTNGQESTTLVKNADLALYRAKAEGRNRVVKFTDDFIASR